VKHEGKIVLVSLHKVSTHVENQELKSLLQ
jgi:hypothetical protein